MARVSRRVGAIEESATLAVTVKAKALSAAGEDVIGFGAGQPDFPTPAPIVEAAQAAAAEPRFHGYTAAGGLPELREAVADKTLRDSGHVVAPGQVLITNGAKQAVYQTFATLLDPGDEVLLAAPYWVTYPESIRLAGGVPVPVATDQAGGFRTTIAALEAAATPRTKALLFVSPSNPTGIVYSRQDIAAIGFWAAQRGLWVVTDEIYEHLVYGDHTHHSLPVLTPELVERCVIINGVAKTYAMTGWRVGWMLGPADVIKAATNLQSHLSGNVSNVSQAAALVAVAGGLEQAHEMRAVFDRRRRRMHELLSAMPGVTCNEPEGAFYAFPSFEGALGREFGGRTAQTTLELAEVILEQARVALVPGEAFGAPGFMRLSYALSDEELEEGLTRLGKFLEG